MKLITQQGVKVNIKPETIQILYDDKGWGGGEKNVVITAMGMNGNYITLGYFKSEDDAEKVLRKIAIIKEVPSYD